MSDLLAFDAGGGTRDTIRTAVRDDEDGADAPPSGLCGIVDRTRPAARRAGL